MTCSTEGCPRPVLARGRCSTHYAEWKRRKDGRNVRSSPEYAAIRRDILIDRFGEPYWTRERIIAAIQRWAKRTGKPPTCDQWARPLPGRTSSFGPASKSRPSAAMVKKVFGTWNEAMKAAGFPPRPAHAVVGRPKKTHCKHGHEWTPANTRTREGVRHCRTCDREWMRTKRASRKAAA
jgi:Homing endonuclease associated repeat